MFANRVPHTKNSRNRNYFDSTRFAHGAQPLISGYEYYRLPQQRVPVILPAPLLQNQSTSLDKELTHLGTGDLE